MFGRKDKFISRIEQLAEGESLAYRLPEVYQSGIGEFAFIELNPDYPEKGKGKKYIVYTDKGENGKPKGQRVRFLDTNKPKNISEWLKDKNATPFD